jgi:hypothetical protein
MKYNTPTFIKFKVYLLLVAIIMRESKDNKIGASIFVLDLFFYFIETPKSSSMNTIGSYSQPSRSLCG